MCNQSSTSKRRKGGEGLIARYLLGRSAGNRRFVAAVLVCWLFQCVIPAAYPQQVGTGDAKTPATQQSFRRITLAFTAGYGAPLSKTALRQFWKGGPAMSASFMVGVNRSVAIGVGLDAAMLIFDKSNFAVTYPGVPVQSRNTTFLNLSIGWRYTPFWKNRFAPYFGATVGAGRFTGAEYKQIVNGVRATYYEIPGITRLSVGGVIGANYVLTGRVALIAEGRGTYLHNDSEAGVVITVSAGIRFFL
jgi:hypothetical protein